MQKVRCSRLEGGGKAWPESKVWSSKEPVLPKKHPMKHQNRWTLLERVRKRRDGLQNTEKMQWESEGELWRQGEARMLTSISNRCHQPWTGEVLNWESLEMGKP